MAENVEVVGLGAWSLDSLQELDPWKWSSDSGANSTCRLLQNDVNPYSRRHRLSYHEEAKVPYRRPRSSPCQEIGRQSEDYAAQDKLQTEEIRRA